MTPANQKIYDKFRNSSLDPSAVGITTGSEESHFPATPENARVIAWAEGYGIHFCTVGEDDTVYLVEPAAADGDGLRPVAANMMDFLGLIVACKHVSLLWQIHEQSREEFTSKLNAMKPGMKHSSVLRAITNIYHPTVIRDPYAYIQWIRAQQK